MSSEVGFSVIGTSFRESPIEVREKFAFDPERKKEFFAFLENKLGHKNWVFLSTCNRTELMIQDESSSESLQKLLLGWLDFLSMDQGYAKHFFTHQGADALKHLFSLTSGLDSMILGEPQIAGQIKDAFQTSPAVQGKSTLIRLFFEEAYRIAKKVRTHTGIGKMPVSVSYVAVELAKKIFDDLGEKKVLLIGAGDMGQLTLRHLLQAGVKDVTVSNRSLVNAAKIAEEFKATAILNDRISDFLPQVDIVISATGAEGYVISEKMIRKSRKDKDAKPLFCIDIAVPRDIDPEINNLDDCYVYDIDDLGGIADRNLDIRKKEAESAQHIVEQETNKLLEKIKVFEISDVIAATVDRFNNELQDSFTDKLNDLGLTDEQKEKLNLLAGRLTKRLMHPSLTLLKKGAEDSALVNAFTEAYEISADKIPFHFRTSEPAEPAKSPKSGEDQAKPRKGKLLNFP